MDQFPIKLDADIKSIPWDLILSKQGKHETIHLKRVADLGGLTPCEAVAIIEGRPWHRMPTSEATQRLKDLVREWEGHPNSAALERVERALELARRSYPGRPALRHRMNEIVAALEGAREMLK